MERSTDEWSTTVDLWLLAAGLQPPCRVVAQVVPKDKRGTSDAERKGTHDANNIRTEFWNYGMVGNYPQDPINVDLTTFHSMEVPKGTGVNYSDGTTPFVLAKIMQTDGRRSVHHGDRIP